MKCGVPLGGCWRVRASARIAQPSEWLINLGTHKHVWIFTHCMIEAFLVWKYSHVLPWQPLVSRDVRKCSGVSVQVWVFSVVNRVAWNPFVFSIAQLRETANENGTGTLTHLLSCTAEPWTLFIHCFCRRKKITWNIAIKRNDLDCHYWILKEEQK